MLNNWKVRLLIGLTAVVVIGAAVKGASNAAIGDKTLVVWASPANLSQKGGSVLTLEKSGGVFDGIVFGELADARWMPGSNYHSRTNTKQDKYPVETADAKTFVQIAVESVLMTDENCIVIGACFGPQCLRAFVFHTPGAGE